MKVIHKLGFWLLRKYPKAELMINDAVLFGGEDKSAIVIKNSNPLMKVTVSNSTIIPEDARAKYKVNGQWVIIREGKKKAKPNYGIQLNPQEDGE